MLDGLEDLQMEQGQYAEQKLFELPWSSSFLIYQSLPRVARLLNWNLMLGVIDVLRFGPDRQLPLRPK